MTTTSTYDTRRYALCAPWDGEVGVTFTRVFCPSFKAALGTKTDKFSNLQAHIEGNDVGGVRPTTPSQYAADNNHVNGIFGHSGTGTNLRESENAFENRAIALVGHIRAHVEVPGIKANIDKMLNAFYANDYINGCPVFPSGQIGALVYPNDHPLGGQPFTGEDLIKYQKYGNSIGRHIWGMVCDAGQRTRNAMYNELMNSSWHNAKLADVGFSRRSMLDFATLLDQLSLERGAGLEKSDEEKRAKFLNTIGTAHPALASLATNELAYASPPCQNPFGIGDFKRTVAHYNDLWMHYYDKGDIKYVPPQVAGQPRSNRVDGLSLAEAEEDEFDDQESYAARDFRPRGTQARQTTTLSFNQLNNEVLCWNCLGWGHTKLRCPSSRVHRSMADSYRIFGQRLARDAQQIPEQPAQARRRPMGRGSQRKPPTANVATDEIDDDDDNNNDEDLKDELEVAAATSTKFSHDVVFGSTEDSMLGLHLEIDENSPPASTNFTNLFRSALCMPQMLMHRWKDSLLWIMLALLITQCMSVRIIPAQAQAMSAKHATTGPGMTTTALIDSGCSTTASGRRSLFPKRRITTINPKLKVVTASGFEMPVAFIGTLVVKPKNAPKKDFIIIDDALHVPAMKDLTLLSPKQMFDKHNIKTHLNDALHIELPSGAKVPIHTTHKSYYLEIDVNCMETAHAAHFDEDNDMLIHQRCMHFSPQRLAASSACTKNLLHPNLRLRHTCEPCVRGGKKKPSTSTKRTTGSDDPRRSATKFGDLIYSDTCSLPPSIPFGYIGWVVFLDHATRWLALYFIRSHTSEEIRRCLDQFCVDNSEYLPRIGGVPAPRQWLTDNHGEFISKDTEEFCRKLYMQHTSIIEWNPQQNASERAHGTILRCIRITHADNNTPLPLWPWTANQCVLVHNRLLTMSQHVISPLKSPFEMRTGAVPDLSRLRRMYCRVTCYNRNEADRAKLTKIDPTTIEGVHLGLDEKRNGIFVYVPSLRRFTTYPFRDSVFYEDDFPPIIEMGGQHLFTDTSLQPPTTLSDPFRAAPGLRGGRARGRGRGSQGGRGGRSGRGSSALAPPAAPSAEGTGPQAAANDANANYISLNHPYHQPIDSISDSQHLCLNLDSVSSLPTPPEKIEDFKDRADEEEWWQAARTEHLAKKKLNTYTLVPRPVDGTNVVKTRLRCTYKIDPETGALLDNKGHRVRWVACGYSQVFKKDYFETYTATTKAAGIRTFASIVAAHDLDTQHIDVNKFFPSHKLKETVYCEQMPGFVEGGTLPDGKSKLVCKLNMALEGLKQSGNTAQSDNVKHLTQECELKQCTHEPTIFIKTSTDKTKKVTLLLLIWIDDIWVAYTKGTKDTTYDPFLTAYKKKYSIKEMGEIKLFIKIAVTRDRIKRTITLSQKTYVTEMVPNFVSNNLLNPISLPSSPCDPVAKSDPYHELVAQYARNDYTPTKQPCLAAIASALYAACMTRPDIAYNVSLLCRFSSRPSPEAWHALVKVLQYLYKMRKRGITYGGPLQLDDRLMRTKPPIDLKLHNKLMGLHIYSDVSWKTMSTYAGFVIMYNNAALDWGSKLLKVMLSSSEAEIGAGCIAGKRAIYVRNLLGEMLDLPSIPIPRIIDNGALP